MTLGSTLTIPPGQAEGAPLPHWKYLARGPEEELARLDPAFVQFVANMGFPGSERLNPNGCLYTLRGWADRVRGYTDRNLHQFRRNPAQFENSEAHFRALCLATVLQREFGVRYDPAKIPRDVPFEVEDTTVHGIVYGNGGTCVSLPVLYASIGRNLGYPIKLVHAWVDEGTGHQFARWDGDGARFNIETTGTGLATPPDDHYRTGRYTMTPEIERRGRFLVSQTPRGELAFCLQERGLRWRDLGNRQYAAEAFAWALALDPMNAGHEDALKLLLNEWVRWCNARMPPGFPEVTIGLPQGHRLLPDALPFDYERRIFGQMSVERLLCDPKLERMWKGMCRGEWQGRSPAHAIIDYRTDGTREVTLE